MKYYIYELWDMIKNAPFYVGKGCGRRTYAHTSKCHLAKTDGNQFKKNVIRKMLLENNKPIVKYVFRTDDEMLAYQEETKLILHYGRRDIGTGILTNLTNGGVGSLSPSEETRYKMGSAKRGKKESAETKKRKSESLTGFIHSDETKLRMSLSKKGKSWDEIYGEEQAAEKKITASKRASAYIHTAETKKRMAEQKLGKQRGPMSQDQKNKISQSVSSKILSDESYNRMINSVKGKSRKYNSDGTWIMVSKEGTK